ncbi:MAG TPA: TIGR03032 family protein [Pirellulales bacterium]|nr:TIGR03032 family protein [Pirellulales bacterium]
MAMPPSDKPDSTSVEKAESLAPAQQAPSADPEHAPLRSVHTLSFPSILAELGISLLVSTYQAGKLVALRAEGELLNTHFRVFNKPMGLAVHGGRLAIGTSREVWEFHNLPAVAQKLEPVGRHDACFLPRVGHVTGDIHIHEMAWAGDELWFVNTAFSCLCTRSDVYSFQPRWRPRFVSGLSPTDRCHLNGLGMRDGRPGYVTALGETDDDGGWRTNKRDGGLLIDITTNEVVARQLSMPHSPRWHHGRLWVLNSGAGGIGTVDLASGRYEEVAQLPGFTRGLSFYGPLAFVGLSQVRESAVFSGIPLVDRLKDRNCGVWVVDLRTGDTVAFVRFEEAVQEIFAVEVLPGLRYPDVLTADEQRLDGSFELSDEAMPDVPATLRSVV